MKNLYDQATYNEISERVNKLIAKQIPLWGKMDVAQMMTHCNEVLLTYNGEKELEVGLLAKLFKGVIHKIVFGPQPYRKNSGTVPQFKITEPQNFEIAKADLQNSIDTFYTMNKEIAQQLIHPLFGQVSLEDRGWAMYKHLDHHLTQFGV